LVERRSVMNQIVTGGEGWTRICKQRKTSGKRKGWQLKDLVRVIDPSKKDDLKSLIKKRPTSEVLCGDGGRK